MQKYERNKNQGIRDKGHHTPMSVTYGTFACHILYVYPYLWYNPNIVYGLVYCG